MLSLALSIHLSLFLLLPSLRLEQIISTLYIQYPHLVSLHNIHTLSIHNIYFDLYIYLLICYIL